MKIYDYLTAHVIPQAIEPTVEAIEAFGTGYGAELTFLSEKHLSDLRNGKMLAFADGEYAHFLILGEKPENATQSPTESH